MPLTPFSYAGAARRARRRGIIAPAYHAPAAYIRLLPLTTGERVHYGYPLVRPAVVW